MIVGQSQINRLRSTSTNNQSSKTTRDLSKYIASRARANQWSDTVQAKQERRLQQAKQLQVENEKRREEIHQQRLKKLEEEKQRIRARASNIIFHRDQEVQQCKKAVAITDWHADIKEQISNKSPEKNYQLDLEEQKYWESKAASKDILEAEKLKELTKYREELKRDMEKACDMRKEANRIKREKEDQEKKMLESILEENEKEKERKLEEKMINAKLLLELGMKRNHEKTLAEKKKEEEREKSLKQYQEKQELIKEKRAQRLAEIKASKINTQNVIMNKVQGTQDSIKAKEEARRLLEWKNIQEKETAAELEKETKLKLMKENCYKDRAAQVAYKKNIKDMNKNIRDDSDVEKYFLEEQEKKQKKREELKRIVDINLQLSTEKKIKKNAELSHNNNLNNTEISLVDKNKSDVEAYIEEQLISRKDGEIRPLLKFLKEKHKREIGSLEN